jgi:hypothetical protein
MGLGLLGFVEGVSVGVECTRFIDGVVYGIGKSVIYGCVVLLIGLVFGCPSTEALGVAAAAAGSLFVVAVFVSMFEHDHFIKRYLRNSFDGV